MPLPNRDESCPRSPAAAIPGSSAGSGGLLTSPPGGAGMGRESIDWARLRAAATEAASRAYAPYSRLRVGAAGLTSDGRVITGCNVENASFGLTLCAECGLVSALHATPPAPAGVDLEIAPAPPGLEPPWLVAVAVVAGDGAPLLPCGRCR